MGDNVTLLRAASKQALAKLWLPDGTIKPAASVKWFKGGEAAITSADDFCGVLDAIEYRPSIALVKEALTPGVDRSRLRRKTVSGIDEATGKPFEAGLVVTPRLWVDLDIENLIRPSTIDFRDGAALADHARALLPSEFKGAACTWQLSGSSGHPSRLDEIRVHLFFMLDAAIFPQAWKDYFGGQPKMEFVDRSAFDRGKLIFTAAPQILAGCDPIAQRHGLLAGGSVVAVRPEVSERSARIASGANNRGQGTPGAPRAAAMPQAAAEFVRIISQVGILRSQSPAYGGDRARRLAFCSVLRSDFGVVDEMTLAHAFRQACFGAGDPNGEHDLQQALDWTRRHSHSGRTFSAHKMLSDAAATAWKAGDVALAARATRFATLMANLNLPTASAAPVSAPL